MSEVPMNDSVAMFKATKCFAELSAICQQYDASEVHSSKNVQLKDKVLSSCQEHGWMTQQFLHMKEVGATPFNRGGEGLLWSRAHSRVAAVSQSGFSRPAIEENAVLLEDNPFTRAFARYTAELCKTDPHYATYSEHSIRYATLGGTHAVHGFACVGDEVPCSIESISVNGKMNKQKVCQNDPLLLKVVEKGMLFKYVMRWEVYAALPTVADIVVGALNTVHQVSEGQTWVENLLTIVKEVNKRSGPVDWPSVTKAVLRSQPPRRHDIADMCDYVRMWGGLPSGNFVKDLAEMLKFTMPSDRVVVGSFFKMLADMKFNMDELPAHVVNALLYTHASSHEMVVDKVARHINKMDVAYIASDKNKMVKEANGILKRIKLITNSEHACAEVMKLRGDVTWKIIKALLRKEPAGKSAKDVNPPKQSLQDILQHEFVNKLVSLKGNVSSSAASSSAAEIMTVAETGDQALMTNVVTYDQNGEVANAGKNTMLNKGFRCGEHFKEKKSSGLDQWRLVDIEGDGTVKLLKVKLLDGSLGDESKTVAPSEFIKDYTATEKIVYFPSRDPELDKKVIDELTIVNYKGMVATALHMLLAKYPSPQVKTLKKPFVTVFAKGAFAAKSQLWIPASTSISIVPSTEATANKTIVRIEGIEAAFATIGRDGNSAYWSMKRNPEQPNCNCHVVLKQVKCKPATLGERFTSEAVTIVIPCIENFKDVEENEELVVLCEPKPTEPAKKEENEKKSTKMRMLFEQSGRGAKKPKA